ncbi:hypothetical protein CC85DRAFT_32503 [Cutaneotrichosporon oleaginosum]|uniref:Histidine kinase n=1 Tax=Cutaneotrichosporon oleaginosum TaxID=879819 RepID=A0A0J0XSV4_9TREE|nr:uncharacterized protein CC85DRAFT_32503 [Cutaneotrichosporon oleaginosum]KLT44142.1 hypothetical protein CC85DRAFT_32503 [Cutaneotrichosporon oleaginosum]TXT09403.1 hypothetical protein COLE_03337 [Cutaneotrichosporon oleaginosum]
MIIPAEGDFRARGLVKVVVDPSPPSNSSGFEPVQRSASTGPRKHVQDEWVTGWASLDPTYEYPLLDDRRLDGRVRFSFCPNDDSAALTSFRRQSQIKALDTVPYKLERPGVASSPTLLPGHDEGFPRRYRPPSHVIAWWEDDLGYWLVEESPGTTSASFTDAWSKIVGADWPQFAATSNGDAVTSTALSPSEPSMLRWADACDLLLQTVVCLQALHDRHISLNWCHPNVFGISYTGTVVVNRLWEATALPGLQVGTQLTQILSQSPLFTRDPIHHNSTYLSESYIFRHLRYLAPEAAISRRVSASNDIYSWGVLAYELLTGTTVDGGPDSPDLTDIDFLADVHRHITNEIIPPHDYLQRVVALGATVEPPPRQLSDIIMLALAKDPEDRYQNLDTLAYDLRKLSQICRANGDLAKFAVGEVDHMSRFSLPATVIERNAELEALDVAFAAVANGNASSRVLNIWGQSGNGKSRLVDEWSAKLEADDFGTKCLVGHAKPDEHIRKPLTSFVQIFQSLLDRVLTDPREDGKEWLDRIKTALAGRWPFFVSLLSVESRRLLNEEDAVSLTPKIEGEKFISAFKSWSRQFLQLFATKLRPLVLVIDDTQWLSQSEVDIWRQIIDGPYPLNHVVIVTMTRTTSSVAPPANSLFSASSTSLAVQRLTEEGVVSYIDTCLNGRVAASGQAIASFLYGETGGSPLFLRTLMSTLLKEQVVAFDFDSLQWRFDLVTLQSHLSDANFDSYLENVMRRLPPDVQELLKILSYLPSAGFPLSKLSQGLGKPVRDLESLMQVCAVIGILSLQPDHFRFTHERQRQAAQRLILNTEGVAMQRRVFHFLTREDLVNDYLYDAVELAVAAHSAGFEVAPPDVVVTLLLDATARATHHANFTAARHFVNSAADIIDKSDGLKCWLKKHRGLCFRYVRLSAEVSSVFHDHAATFAALDTIKPLCETSTESISLATLLVRQLVAANRTQEAMDVLFQTLDEFGYNPDNPQVVKLWQPESVEDVEQFEKELRSAPVLGGSDSEDDHVLIMSLIGYAGPTIYITQPERRASVFGLGLSVAKELGKLHDSTAYVLAIHSVCITQAPIQNALRGLALRITEMRPNRLLTNSTLIVLGAQSHCFMGLERVQDVMTSAFDGSVALADYEVAAYVVALDLIARLFAKVPVAWEVVTRRWELVKPYATTSHHLLVNLPHQYAECLARPKQRAPWDMDGVFFSRSDFNSVRNLRMHVGTYDVLTLRLQLLYDAPPELILQTLNRGRKTIPSNEGVATGSEMHWLLALAALRTGTNLDLLDSGREFLATYAPYSPDLNARLELLNTYERLSKDPFEALKDAEATIEHFEDNDQMLLSGLLNFYTADLLIKRTGSPKLAAGFIRAAFTAYKLYQAAGLCEMLRDRYPLHCPSTPVAPRGPTDFLNADAVPPPLRRESVSVSVSALTNSDSTVISKINDDPTTPNASSPFTDNNLDTLALMRSSLALAQEKDSLVLLCTLLRILCQFARCDYAAIGLSDEDDKSTLRLKAAGPFQRITSYDLDASDDAAQTVCPTSVMLHVARTGIPITKPAKASRLRNDPFYNGRQPRTLLCLPIINQGGQSGVILLLSMSSTSAAVQSESAREVVSTLATFAHIIHTHHVYTSRLKTEVTMRTRELSNALQAKTQFLSQCSHELRSPLAAIMGLASVLETSSGLTAVQHEHLQTIIASGQDLLALISNILDHSKLESNSVQLESIPFSVREVVEGALDIIAPVAQSKNVELTVLTTLKSDPPGVIGDPFRVKQVLLNLLSNAVKFTPPGQAGRRTARVTVDRTWEDLGDGRIKVALTVADTGVGIPASKLHKLFKSFSQVDESITRSYGGSGLGLVISRDLARLLGGDCTVESEFGKGSTFTFTFVAQQDPSWQPTKLRRFETTQDVFILSGGDMMWGHVLEEDLKEFNCRPTWFTEPLPAALTPGHPLGFNSGRYYQGIILDTSLIEPETLDEIKKLQPNAKIIYVAKATEISREMERLSFGRDEILARPLKFKSLYNMIIPPPDNKKKRTAPRSKHKINRNLATEKPLEVLVVDDSPVNVAVCRRILELYGYKEVDAASDGMQAVEMAEKHRYDLILLDLQMPILDGFGALKRIRDSPLAGEPCVASLSANVDKATQNRCTDAGFFAVLCKPVDIPRLGELLEEVWETRQKALQ